MSQPAPRTSGRKPLPSAKQRQNDLDREMKELEQRQKAIRAAIREEQQQEELRGYSPSVRLSRNPDVESEDDEEDYECMPARRNMFETRRVDTGPPARQTARNGDIVPVREPSSTRTNRVGIEVPQHFTVNLRAGTPAGESRDASEHPPSSPPTYPPSSSPSSSPTPGHRHKRKSSTESDSADDIDTQGGSTTITMKKVKVSIPAATGSRQRYKVGDFHKQGVVKGILEDAIGVFRALVSTQNAFPKSSVRDDLVTSAWVEACRRRKVEIECETVCEKLIKQRDSQSQGQSRLPLVPLSRRCTACRMSPRDPENRKGIFQHPSLQAIINQAWFKNSKDDGPSYPAQFSQDGKLPLVTIALVYTAIECILDQWVTGEFVDVPFASSVYHDKYETHLANLQSFDKKTATSKIIPQLCEHLLKVARRNAKVVDVQQERQAIFTEDDFSAAVDDWKDFNPSDSVGGQDD
ncbi:hypothetical protein NMY22_g1794 [Coprinellus aureogranulatus]|nr:hypothetical protein NMY22_g1794 [Coprinellus aureogranulatus]